MLIRLKAGWGANMGIHRITGCLDETEAELHINIPELMAVEIAKIVPD